GTLTPITTPTSPAAFAADEHPEDHRNWMDSELLSSLHLDALASPPGSNPTSRPGSQPSSRPNSRPASPDHSREVHPPRDFAPMTPTASSSANSFVDPPPLLSRSSTGASGFFHLHIPKPLRPLTSFSRNASSSSLMTMGRNRGEDHHAHHPSASALSTALEAHAAKSGPSSASHSHSNSQSHSPLETITHSAVSNSPIGPSADNSPLSSSPATTIHGPSLSSTSSPYNSHSHSNSLSLTPAHSHSQPHSGPTSTGASPAHTPYGDGEEAVDFLSQVPSYDVAARGFLGGGVVPLSMSSRLPNYED
ncbi:hypothetical protein P7C70_g4924, partial [Phenoliferia sp. Uapishka_3]